MLLILDNLFLENIVESRISLKVDSYAAEQCRVSNLSSQKERERVRVSLSKILSTMQIHTIQSYFWSGSLELRAYLRFIILFSFLFIYSFNCFHFDFFDYYPSKHFFHR